jgi:hypothetical protein
MKKPFYPVLFAIFPVLLLLAANVTQVWSVRGLRPILVAALAAGLLMLLLRLLLRDWDRAAWATSLIIAVLHYQVMLWLIPVGLVAVLLWKRPLELKNVYFNSAAALMALIPLVMIGILAGPRDWPKVRHVAAASQPGKPAPDIYFIILDSHAGHEALLQRFGYDNSPFLQALQADGFTTGDCSSSYDNTAPSLASTLNFGKFDPNSGEIWNYIRNSAVRQMLEARGYKTIAFEDGYDWSELMDASTYIHTPTFGRMTDFESYYLRQTLIGKIPVIQEALQAVWGNNYRLRLLNTLTELPNVASLPGPKLVFVHLIMPHPPFIIHADGSPADDHSLLNPNYTGIVNSASAPEYTLDNYAIGYVDQVSYIDRVMPGILHNVLSNSNSDPIVIVQGDHGARYSQGEDRFSILCAVHTPTGIIVPLEPENTFEFLLLDK